ncbi:3 beta-hydroxysteroid dehydrogenase/Delta 5--_4-isomerase type 3 isoform X2 [Parasteatoda tepidariorum]|nr:3 beta-hydroxysteroid dehydrogenase/Delta 5-->4-isomerase type 3 isoform X2 [Parasteatoda tepidariorum]XP_015905092.1 3 beta-hydroxysteroid dehydrogenase/Delta 5-->4-isomerase type 3 isoform X2 [Parasteatoda tepidariorum]
MTEKIVITGSSGCLGQHIVKLLQEKDDNCGEIILFDKKPYSNNLGHSETKPMKHYIADVRDMQSLVQAFEGADCVIHAACVIDLDLNPDVKEMMSTNVEGTAKVIDACIKANVPRLVFASTTDMVCGSEHIFYGTESTTPIPNTWMIGKYGETKCLSEKLVVEASGKTLSNGKDKLRTAAIRPTPFYGEEDKHFFYRMLKMTKNYHGYYQRIRSLDERLQICYVGNAAWAHINAKNRLVVDETISGEAFYITDDTPIIDIHEHAAEYLNARGFTVSTFIFPYWLAWLLLSLLILLISVINVFVKFNPNIPPVSQLNYMCSTFFYNRSKATLRLDYQPIFTPEEAKEKSMEYYVKVPL